MLPTSNNRRPRFCNFAITLDIIMLYHCSLCVCVCDYILSYGQTRRYRYSTGVAFYRHTISSNISITRAENDNTKVRVMRLFFFFYELLTSCVMNNCQLGYVPHGFAYSTRLARHARLRIAYD